MRKTESARSTGEAVSLEASPFHRGGVIKVVAGAKGRLSPSATTWIHGYSPRGWVMRAGELGAALLWPFVAIHHWQCLRRARQMSRTLKDQFVRGTRKVAKVDVVGSPDGKGLRQVFSRTTQKAFVEPYIHTVSYSISTAEAGVRAFLGAETIHEPVQASAPGIALGAHGKRDRLRRCYISSSSIARSAARGRMSVSRLNGW